MITRAESHVGHLGKFPSSPDTATGPRILRLSRVGTGAEA